MAKTVKNKDKQDRLAEALRQNLKRRKEQGIKSPSKQVKSKNDDTVSSEE